ncbi:MAG: signal recognition particle-docking protein FtsY [Methylovulum sp.]|uniref:signal recognition particle-docking protein FtsY n=1 Tax=Methylovulum sp. TaxID=1916980 RepID=UPI002603490A|nr:signal recognition particle-docking protein FtsY [Methylovulum sp.]MDD2722780.1 signal recognition particle-docking protein FtsY [Methylovulum sp.]MDD5124556.1 signal recognition particle-docking protein FtsY [Methylovulum sp.]
MFRKLTLFSVVLALIVIVLGAYSRFSGGQLSCPDWPTCYGQLFIGDISQLNMPSGVGLVGIWKELAYRYAYLLLGLIILPMVILSWREKSSRLVAVATMSALLVCVGSQAILNYWLVKLQAMPIVVTGSIILNMVSFWLLCGLYLYSKANIILLNKAASVWFCRFAMLVLFLQISLGAWVSANHASLVCVGFPQCNGQWLPVADYQNALNLLGGLLSGYSGDLSYDQQVAVNVLHRWGAVVCFFLLTALIWGSLSVNKPRPVRVAALWLSLLVFVEISLGIAGFKLAMPVWVVVVHNAIAALLMLPLLAISFYSRYGLMEAEPVLAGPEPAVATVSEDIAEALYEEPAPESLLLRLKSQLKRTRSGLGGILTNLALGSKAIDQDLLEDLETRLLMADIGINVTTDIIAQLTQRLERHQLSDGEALSAALKEELLNILQPCNQPLCIPKQDKPFVILVVGVNGAGKTTTIGKLAKRLQVQGHSVMLAAGDTFRAAAVEQLQTWGERNKIHVVAQHTGADSASVIYDGVQSAQAKGIDVLIADTAGRLHTKSNLMDELKKVKRIMAKLDETAPHEVLLVLDAGTGQNALSQAKLFNEAVALTGLVLTKLDGTAKGGVIFALAKQSGIPIRFIGIGEGIDDLQDFNAENFVNALFAND